jgi:predicted O-methyltransferase YrrM
MARLALDRSIDPKVNGYGEHYSLLTSFSKQMPKGSVIVDVGTYQGYSAVALASNPGVSVVTYDIQDFVKIPLPANVRQIVRDSFECIPEICQSDLILLDISPHDGIKEQRFFDELLKNGFQGVLILDDIHWGLDAGMNSFWNSIPLKKFDVTSLGHYTGTGIVVFDAAKWDVE